MKAIYLLFLSLILSVSIFAQDADSIPYNDSATNVNTYSNFVSKVTSPADSAAIMDVANQYGIPVNPNASKLEIVNTVVKLYRLWPPHGVAQWCLWITVLLVLIGNVYFAWRMNYYKKAHAALKAKTGAVSILLFIAILSAFSSCKVTTTAVTPYGGTITTAIGKGWYLQESIAIHTAPFQNDSATFIIYGSDTTTNAFLTDIKNYIDSKIPGLPSLVPLKPAVK